MLLFDGTYKAFPANNTLPVHMTNYYNICIQNTTAISALVRRHNISKFKNGFYSESISSINIPYPLVESLTNTCVTAPIILLFCITGEPLIPCTFPPDLLYCILSVTFITIPLFSLELIFIFSISTS